MKGKETEDETTDKEREPSLVFTGGRRRVKKTMCGKLRAKTEHLKKRKKEEVEGVTE